MPPAEASRPMPQRSVPPGLRYTATAQALHWLTALLVFIVLPLAWIAINLPKEDPSKPVVFIFHKSVGLTIFAIVALRILWRSFNPAPPDTTEPRALATLGRVNHWLLYAIFLYMPITGFLLSSLHGHALPYFYLFTIPALGDNQELSEAFETMHVIGQWAVYALVALHIAASVWHAAIRRDGVLSRMLPRRSDAA